MNYEDQFNEQKTTIQNIFNEVKEWAFEIDLILRKVIILANAETLRG